MDIEIKINHFGPLSNITLNWAPFMVLTGHSNLGKSYANYLIYYVISGLIGDRFSSLYRGKFPQETDKGEVKLTLSEIENYLNENVQDYMRSFLGDDLLECDVEIKIKAEITEYHLIFEREVSKASDLELPQELPYNLIFNGQNIYSAGSFYTILFWFNYYTIRSIFQDETLFKAVLLPPGRGAFVGENYSTHSAVASSVGMYREYFRDYDGSLLKSENQDESENNDVYEIISSFVGGEFVSEKSKQYIILSTGEKISLTAAASSIKEISPLLFYFLNKGKMKISYCLEEPEAHLHPCSQIKIADLIASFLNKGNMFQITTHSDYFLQRINQLIKLGDIRKADEEAFEKLCDERGLLKSSYIDRSKVKAYYFHKNAEGKVEVEDMPLTQDGISYKTFYDITRDLNEREEYINEQLYKLNEK